MGVRQEALCTGDAAHGVGWGWPSVGSVDRALLLLYVMHRDLCVSLRWLQLLSPAGTLLLNRAWLWCHEGPCQPREVTAGARAGGGVSPPRSCAVVPCLLPRLPARPGGHYW